MVQIQLFILFYGLLSLGIKYFIFIILYYLFLVFEVKIVIIGIIVQVQLTSSPFSFFFFFWNENFLFNTAKTELQRIQKRPLYIIHPQNQEGQ